jgi:hypothetical protein
VRRHVIIADTQVRAGVPTEHLSWAAQWIVEHKPDAIVHIGDHWDMPSLSAYDLPGTLKAEGQRYETDVEVGNAAFRLLSDPIQKEVARIKRNKKRYWEPECHFLFGNHEQRIHRALNQNPKFAGMIGDHHLLTPGFKRHGFLERAWIDGIVYSHFFQSPHSSHAIGGSIDNRLNKIGASFVQGHEQGLRYGTRIQASGANWHGLVAGSFYAHDEDYRGAQGQSHWRGIVVLNEVRNGDYCVMPLTIDYLCRWATGQGIGEWLRANYKDAESRFTLARESA